MRICGISGSLRSRSSTTVLLRAAGALAPPGVELDLFDGLGEVPAFNPDLDFEGATPPPSVGAMRARLAGADAVLIATPEYAHGVPGALKNALDWLVSTVELIDKPVGVVTASPSGGEHAHAQLTHTLATMSWRVVDAACVRLAIGRNALDDAGRLTDEAAAAQLRAGVAALVAAST